MTSKDYIEGLKAVIAFYEAHPLVVAPTMLDFPIYQLDTKEEAAMLLKEIGAVEKSYDDYYLRLKKTVGNGASVTFIFTRQNVCERVVVGTKVVPAEVIPAQEAVEEQHLPEREVEVVEWRCGSLMAPAGSAA